MRVYNDKLKAEFRYARICENCGARGVTECCHVFARGMAGGSTLDVRINLIALGYAFGCACHQNSHAGNNPDRFRLLDVVAQREGMSRDEVEWRIRRMLAAPKEATPCVECEARGRVGFAGPFCPHCQGSGVLLHGLAWFLNDADRDRLTEAL